MVKQFILLIQLIGVFIYQLVLTGDVTVTQNVPSSISAGNGALVEITVTKGQVTGFAKVQQDIPAGFMIEPAETKGATFSFKDNRIKFIWMALPAEETFTVSYTLKPLAETKGEFNLGGKFSFISNSERQNVEIPTANFSVTEEQLLAEEPEETSSPEGTEETTEPAKEEENSEVPEDESASSEETTEEPVADNTEETSITEPEPTPVSAKVSSSREIEQTEEGKYTVRLTISKENVVGFAKVTEEIPAGFVATEGSSAGGVFSFREQKMKVLWMSIPKGAEMVIEYNLEATTAENGDYAIKGALNYLENDETQEHSIASSSFNLEKTDVIAEVPEEEPSTQTEEETETEEPEVIEEPEIVEETQDNGSSESTEENTVTDVTSTPAPETGVSYKVQVGAGHQTVPNNWFATKFNLQEEINTENHEGWIKYVVGSYSVYKDARDKRNTVRTKVKRAFVTAYSSGKRITVQEALMISNQKWYK